MSGSDLPGVLVVGIGNTDRGDDGVGPAVAQRLRGRVPPAVGVLECGGDALTLLDDWEGFAAVILVDAVTPIDEPGRVHRIDLVKNPLPFGFAPPSTHAFGLAEAVELARSLQRLPPRLVAYLVEAEQFDTGAPLSPILTKVVEDVVERISVEVSAMAGSLQAQGTL
jgi:hydrogenase maturation protease